jgi:hypothetical protein
MNRPFDHGRPSAKRGRNMQDSAAASAVGWNATQSHVVSAERRGLQPGAGGTVGAVVRYTTDLSPRVVETPRSWPTP